MPRTLYLLATVLASATSITACTGTIGGIGSGSADSPGSSPEGNGGLLGQDGGPDALPGSPDPSSLPPGSSGSPDASSSPPGSTSMPPPSGPFVPAPAALRRLTVPQYRNAVRDLFGATIRVPTTLPADSVFNGSVAIGTSSTTISASGVEAFETAARDLAHQALTTVTQRQTLARCTPTGPGDQACARTLVAGLGRRVFRRPLRTDEVTLYAGLVASVGQARGDFWLGAEAGVSALLQSPSFLYRTELGVTDPADATRRKYDNYEMASRLGFTLWNTTPDDALLDAASRNELATPEGVVAQARRLLASPRTRAEAATLFAEMYGLNELDELAKDPATYTRFTPTLGAAMKRETLAVLDDIAFARDADMRELLDTHTTFVDAELARLYGLPVPTSAGMVRVTLPADSPRAGLLGQGSFLALQSNATATSPTLRGLFVRGALLCQDIPPPPPNVSTMLPLLDTSRPHTARERLEVHRSDPSCAGCHSLMDPIGLTFEHFDGLGAYRATDQGLPLDTSGELDGMRFTDPRGLAAVLRGNPAVAACMVRKLYRYATGHVETAGERVAVYQLEQAFQRAGHRLQPLLLEMVASDGFRYASTPR